MGRLPKERCKYGHRITVRKGRRMCYECAKANSKIYARRTRERNAEAAVLALHKMRVELCAKDSDTERGERNRQKYEDALPDELKKARRSVVKIVGRRRKRPKPTLKPGDLCATCRRVVFNSHEDDEEEL